MLCWGKLKGFLLCLVADNLGAHSIAGFLEKISDFADFCRFCTAQNVNIQTKEVKSGTFSVRSKDINVSHRKAIQD